jgi:hypothetical protein
MKVQYCWRCKGAVPMFAEDELPELLDLMNRAQSEIDGAFAAIDDFHRSNRYDEVKARFKELTGLEMTLGCFTPFHRLADYGPPCGRCGRPLRTERASFCAACGWRRYLS